MHVAVLLLFLYGLSKQHSKSLESSSFLQLLTSWLSEEKLMFLSPTSTVGSDTDKFQFNGSRLIIHDH